MSFLQIDISEPDIFNETNIHFADHPAENNAGHILFQISQAIFLVACLIPPSKRGLIAFHSLTFAAFSFAAIWSWKIICASGLFPWHFSYVFVNGIQTLYLLVAFREIKLSNSELEDAFETLFEPMKINRIAFQKLVSSEYAQLATLDVGEAYAIQNITKTDRLGLLLSGRVNVINGNHYLHSIEAMQFLDSPEFESYRVGMEDKFKVSIIADSPCTLITWSRQSLDYLLVKETFLAHILTLILAKDVADKLYAMNEKIVTEQGSHLDIRLPAVTQSLCNSVSSLCSDGVQSPVRSNLNNIRIKDRSISPTFLKKTERSKSLQVNSLKPPMFNPSKRMSAESIFKSPNGVNGIRDNNLTSSQRVLA